MVGKRLVRFWVALDFIAARLLTLHVVLSLRAEFIQIPIND